MVSFDVTSLFTSIPQDLAVAVIRSCLQQEKERHHNPLHTEDHIQLMSLCLRMYFTFQGTIYEQVKGTLMGFLISGIIAEEVLQQLESKVMSEYRPKFWARYVDGTFCCHQMAGQCQVHEPIKFSLPRYLVYSGGGDQWHSHVSRYASQPSAQWHPPYDHPLKSNTHRQDSAL